MTKEYWKERLESDEMIQEFVIESAKEVVDCNLIWNDLTDYNLIFETLYDDIFEQILIDEFISDEEILQMIEEMEEEQGFEFSHEEFQQLL